MKQLPGSHVNISISMTTEPTTSIDEDSAIQLKMPDKASKWTLTWDCFNIHEEEMLSASKK